MLWFILALSTAVFWGAGYSISERVLQAGVSPGFFLAALCALSMPIYLALDLWNKTTQSSIEALSADHYRLGWWALAAIVAYILGNIFIFYAIQLKNATYANLIEITYPLFTILFTYLFFKNVHVDWTTALGGLLILSGTALIIYRGA